MIELAEEDIVKILKGFEMHRAVDKLLKEQFTEDYANIIGDVSIQIYNTEALCEIGDICFADADFVVFKPHVDK